MESGLQPESNASQNIEISDQDLRPKISYKKVHPHDSGFSPKGLCDLNPKSILPVLWFYIKFFPNNYQQFTKNSSVLFQCAPMRKLTK